MIGSSLSILGNSYCARELFHKFSPYVLNYSQLLSFLIIAHAQNALKFVADSEILHCFNAIIDLFNIVLICVQVLSL